MSFSLVVWWISIVLMVVWWSFSWDIGMGYFVLCVCDLWSIIYGFVVDLE